MANASPNLNKLAEDIAQRIRQLNLTIPFGGVISDRKKEVVGRLAKPYKCINFSRGQWLDGEVHIYSPNQLLVWFDSINPSFFGEHQIAFDKKDDKNIERVKRFLEVAFIDRNKEQAMEIAREGVGTS